MMNGDQSQIPEHDPDAKQAQLHEIGNDLASKLWQDCFAGTKSICTDADAVTKAVDNRVAEAVRTNPQLDPFLIFTNLDVAVSQKQIDMLKTAYSPDGQVGGAGMEKIHQISDSQSFKFGDQVHNVVDEKTSILRQEFINHSNLVLNHVLESRQRN